MADLTSKQRAQLRGLAKALEAFQVKLEEYLK